MAIRKDSPFGELKVIQIKPIHTTLILFLAMLVVVVVALLFTVRTGEVRGTEVGLIVNNITGNVAVIDRPGTTIYNGLYKTFHKIDKTVQKLEMSGGDSVRIKTSDGSDVQLAATIQYQIDGSKIVESYSDSGVGMGGNAYKENWARDYARSICRTVFGELTTEEFYDTAKRTTKAIKSQEILQYLLNPHGFNIITVIPKEFSFYTEYEEMIREKKRADQAVEEQRLRPTRRDKVKERRQKEEEANKAVAIANYKGQMDQIVIQAGADAARIKKEADAYNEAKRLEADAEFYQREKNAHAILATKTAEAEGVAKMAEALRGEGGVNIVKMEYAKRLAQMSVTGQPFTRAGQTERFERLEQKAAVMAPSRAPADTTRKGEK